MSDELQQFITWLETDLTHFVAIVEEGSVVAGDPWQEGFSDHDLNIIVSDDIQSESKAIYDYLLNHPLGNEYLVGLRLESEFAEGDSLNDISLKFRTKALAGKDVVLNKKLPDQQKAYDIGYDGLVSLNKRFERRWINLAHWSEEYTQAKNYEIFKNFFVYFSALHYGKTGEYPTKRADAAKLLSNQVAAACLLDVTNNIVKATKEKQKKAIEAALILCNEILKDN